MNRDLTLCPPTVAVGVAHDAPALPRFLVRQSPYRYWYIWDSLLGQSVGREYDTRAQAMQGIEDRFSIIYGLEVVE